MCAFMHLKNNDRREDLAEFSAISRNVEQKKVTTVRAVFLRNNGKTLRELRAFR